MIQTPGGSTCFKLKLSEYLVVERGVSGRAVAMRAIAPSTPPNV
jgi:hypothetical protein